jgi:hypothetical protein
MKVPNQPYITAADGRPYLNPAYHGFPDEQGNAKRILAKMLEIKVRADAFSKEIAAKNQKIKRLEMDAGRARVDAYIRDDVNFPDISEVDALKADVRELDARRRAAIQATEILAGQLMQLQQEYADEWLENLRGHEEELQAQYAKAQSEVQRVLAEWRAHAKLVCDVQGESRNLDFEHPEKPILTAEEEPISLWELSEIK